jgi:hypothetical protein
MAPDNRKNPALRGLRCSMTPLKLRAPKGLSRTMTPAICRPRRGFPATMTPAILRPRRGFAGTVNQQYSVSPQATFIHLAPSIFRPQRGSGGTPRRQISSHFRPRKVDPVSLLFDGHSFLPVTQGAKSADFQRPAFPPPNPTSRECHRGPLFRARIHPPKGAKW